MPAVWVVTKNTHTNFISSGNTLRRILFKNLGSCPRPSALKSNNALSSGYFPILFNSPSTPPLCFPDFCSKVPRAWWHLRQCKSIFHIHKMPVLNLAHHLVMQAACQFWVRSFISSRFLLLRLYGDSSPSLGSRRGKVDFLIICEVAHVANEEDARSSVRLLRTTSQLLCRMCTGLLDVVMPHLQQQEWNTLPWLIINLRQTSVAPFMNPPLMNSKTSIILLSKLSWKPFSLMLLDISRISFLINVT